MSNAGKISVTALLLTGSALASSNGLPRNGMTLTAEDSVAAMAVIESGDLRTYELKSNAPLRDNRPSDKKVVFSEKAEHASIRSGNVMFDGLYAMAVHEAIQNSVSEVTDGAYGNGAPIRLDAFQTGEKWKYVWTRDLAYSLDLALAGFDPPRAVSSLLFKTSSLKSSISDGFRKQIIQDTGSGGSYPVSTDRVVWALGAQETLKYLSDPERKAFLKKIYPVLSGTIEQDRVLVYDARDGLYRGEQSFLDWREQTYPGWTKDSVLPIALSKSLSVNVANYFLLKTTAEYAKDMNKADDAVRYNQWADELKVAINRQFYDSQEGLYSTYLLSDGLCDIRARRYDLLGESLAILFGIADESRAKAILNNYPVGPYGPSVVWSQERTVPIYHNQGIWPFVTAYWTKAARKANHVEAVDLGIRSLKELTAFNLSNMENYDFSSGLAEVKGRDLNGPVINSRRQLWSIAGYLSMVQDVVFGLETSMEGIRFQPFITSRLRNETFGAGDTIELRNFAYRDTRNTVRIHLPPVNSLKSGVYAIRGMTLNGKQTGSGFIPVNALRKDNQWDIYLQAPEPVQKPSPLKMVDVSDKRTLYGPLQPTWNTERGGGITVEDGCLVLHYRHSDAENVTFNIYRDGKMIAREVKQTSWVDESAMGYAMAAHCYAVEAVDAETGNASHMTPFLCYYPETQNLVISARDMKNKGGRLVADNHFENWGQSSDELVVREFTVERSGRYVLQTQFSNGSGPVNTGITCAVKKLEVREAGTDKMVGSGYLIMPQSGTWERWDMSSPVIAKLTAGKRYSLRICEDEYSKNMSYLKKNQLYTPYPGGGTDAYNYVNIAAVHLNLAEQTVEQLSKQ
jgi:hypothetical protein